MQKCGLTLNAEKCEFCKQSIQLLGHIIDIHGIRAYPDKVKAIVDMLPPANTTEVRRFLGMANQLGTFSQELADASAPLHALLRKNMPYYWEQQQNDLLVCVKRWRSLTGNLCLYDRCKRTIVSADASSFVLGCVLMQRQEIEDWKRVSFASRALTQAEKRYAQIGKEALAITWACERFSDYPIGLNFETKTRP